MEKLQKKQRPAAKSSTAKPGSSESKPKAKAKAKAARAAAKATAKAKAKTSKASADSTSEPAKKRARKEPPAAVEAPNLGPWSDKEKRRSKAGAAWKKLQGLCISGLDLPAQLNGRISFTVKDPLKKGCSVGVLLSTESFYINKALDPSEWPKEVGSDLKAGCGFGHVFFISRCFLGNKFSLLHVCIFLIRWTPKVG